MVKRPRLRLRFGMNRTAGSSTTGHRIDEPGEWYARDPDRSGKGSNHLDSDSDGEEVTSRAGPSGVIPIPSRDMLPFTFMMKSWYIERYRNLPGATYLRYLSEVRQLYREAVFEGPPASDQDWAKELKKTLPHTTAWSWYPRPEMSRMDWTFETWLEQLEAFVRQMFM